jgi:hypothetical protein
VLSMLLRPGSMSNIVGSCRQVALLLQETAIQFGVVILKDGKGIKGRFRSTISKTQAVFVFCRGICRDG